MKERTIWFALSYRNYIFATWYKECSQPFYKWRQAVLSINPNAKIVYKKIII